VEGEIKERLRDARSREAHQQGNELAYELGGVRRTPLSVPHACSVAADRQAMRQCAFRAQHVNNTEFEASRHQACACEGNVILGGCPGC